MRLKLMVLLLEHLTKVPTAFRPAYSLRNKININHTITLSQIHCVRSLEQTSRWMTVL
jgi:hypothetical protein